MNQNVSHFIDYNNTRIPAVNIISKFLLKFGGFRSPPSTFWEEKERSGHGHETFQI